MQQFFYILAIKLIKLIINNLLTIHIHFISRLNTHSTFVSINYNYFTL